MNNQYHSGIRQSVIPRPYLSDRISGDTNRYCKLLAKNINRTNYCKPDRCHYTDGSLKNMPWMKRSVRATDNAEFVSINRISGGNMGSGLKYGTYTPFQRDPTWEESKMLKMFPNGCKTLYNHRFV